MNLTTYAWQVIEDASDDLAYAAMAGDRSWNGFSIADLEPPFRSFTRIATAQRTESTLGAACLILETSAFNMVIPYGDPSGVAAILENVELPKRTGVMMKSEHIAPIRERYDFPDGLEPMIRMAVNAADFAPASSVPGLKRLTLPDHDDLVALYHEYPANHFDLNQLEYGAFFGVREGEQLVAGGGTIVASSHYSVAALGSIFTTPASRGRGYAGAITSSLVAELFDRGYRDVILNVIAANETARRVYTRIGFHDYCPFDRGDAVLRGK